MSDSDLEEVPLTNWFDSESNFPEIRSQSSVNSTIELGINVSSPSAIPLMFRPLGPRIAIQQVQAPIRGIQWVTFHWKRRNPIKGLIC